MTVTVVLCVVSLDRAPAGGSNTHAVPHAVATRRFHVGAEPAAFQCPPCNGGVSWVSPPVRSNPTPDHVVELHDAGCATRVHALGTFFGGCGFTA